MKTAHNERIVPRLIEEELRASFIDYSMSVIVQRALPDVRDGLKPVHRRILYAMHELKNDYNKPYKKSARVVGDVIGKYHPHGDSAIYDTLVRMAPNNTLLYMRCDNPADDDPETGSCNLTRTLAAEELADWLAADPTGSGDGLIICQYLEINDIDSTRNYATMGIQDPTGTDGVLHTYYARNAPGAAPLVAGTAITYVPAGRLSPATCEIEPLSLDFAVIPGGEAERILHIANHGEPGATLLYQISQVDPELLTAFDKSLLGSGFNVTVLSRLSRYDVHHPAQCARAVDH